MASGSSAHLPVLKACSKALPGQVTHLLRRRQRPHLLGPRSRSSPVLQPQQIHEPRPSRRLCLNCLPTWRRLGVCQPAPSPRHTHTRAGEATPPLPASRPLGGWETRGRNESGGLPLGPVLALLSAASPLSRGQPTSRWRHWQVSRPWSPGEESLARSHLHLAGGEDGRPDKASAAAAPCARTAAKAPATSACGEVGSRALAALRSWLPRESARPQGQDAGEEQHGPRGGNQGEEAPAGCEIWGPLSLHAHHLR